MVIKAVWWMSRVVVVLAAIAFVGLVLAPRFGWHLEVVSGGSMGPALMPGSLAVVQPVEPGMVQAGDIISYRAAENSAVVTTHRVVRVLSGNAGAEFQTKGDANEARDPYTVVAGDVVGRVWVGVPYAGILLTYVRTPLGLGLLIGLPALLIIAMESRNIWITLTRQRTERRYRVR
jgi:signal peptidase